MESRATASRRCAPETKRCAIIDAAKRLLTSAHYEDISVDAIAREAGISKATFYAYFDSKETLRRALQADGVGGLDVKDKRATIIEAALLTFAERGFHATSLEDVAEAAGVTKGTVYWYFKQKEDLLRAVAERISPLVGQLQTLWEVLDRPPEEVLPLFIRTCFATFNNPMAGRFFRILVAEVPHYPDIARSFAQIISGVLEFFTAYLQRQTTLGRLRPSDINSTSHAFMGTLLIYIMG
ncbi:MAG: TetR/AcrR family transcriptional regulator, partial [Dehalococcoidia bacterium]|nr:TetR/AcrR family transcriptional regulator [Dehalococcoidia bacterium]